MTIYCGTCQQKIKGLLSAHYQQEHPGKFMRYFIKPLQTGNMPYLELNEEPEL